jgi:hypothetical protein
MVHTTPTKALLPTTLRPVVRQLSGSLAQSVRLLDQCLTKEPTPQKMAEFERELNALWREVGRRMTAWVLHHGELENPERLRLVCNGRDESSIDARHLVALWRRSLAQ